MTSQTSTFTSCMHDQMLESNRDDVKLEAMRCVTVMIAKGKLSVPRTLFPHIVKNVSSKNPELKKLIYLYLTNFADQEPDLALLPVASLQKSLKSPNPLIRSSALKVLTSMRLNILSAILMATLRNSVNDLSPYVRKTVAHAIIKIYRLEPGLKSDLIEYIERLFNDKNSMVLSSAVASFEVVCPERLELVQNHYKRFCFILADCNEWGQTLLLKLLVRYVLKVYEQTKSSHECDPRILLRSAKPLIHSNNSAVVMAVIKLHIAIAHYNEIRSIIPKPMIRLLYNHREIQLTVLNMIEDLTRNGDEVTVQNENDGTDNEENDYGKASYEEVKTAVDGDAKVIDEHDKEVEKDNLDENNPANDTGENDKQENEIKVLDEQSSLLKKPEEQDSSLEKGLENNEEGVKVKESETKVDEGEDEVGDEEQKDEAEDDDDDDDDDGDSDDDEEDDEEEEDDDDDEEEEEDEESEIDDKKREPDAISNKSEQDGDTQKDLDLSAINIKLNNDPNLYREIFRPYIKSFFVKHTDCTQVRLSKLRILTNLSSSVNVSLVLRELQAYISTYADDKEFVSGAIHAIGRCAIIVKEVSHSCLNKLTSLLSNNNEHIVSEAIVVLRSQIIKESEEAQDDKMVSKVIKQVTKLLPIVTAPQARATILWILGEFCDKNVTAAKCTPNVLRSIAKSFCEEDNFVKLQSLTLISKFLLFLDKDKRPDLHRQIDLLSGYLFSLSKYDVNHDVRDRGRFLKKLLYEEEVCAKVLNVVKSTA